jgi:hypothetical protein
LRRQQLVKCYVAPVEQWRDGIEIGHLQLLGKREQFAQPS